MFLKRERESECVRAQRQREKEKDRQTQGKRAQYPIKPNNNESLNMPA